MAEYLTYWKPQTVAQEKGTQIDHSASEQFGKIVPGDILWFVTYENGSLYLIGRMEVERVVSQHEAERILQNDNLWEATYHVLAKRDTITPVTYISLMDIASTLRFEGVVDRLRPDFTAQSFQSMRRLTVESSNLLRGVWLENGTGQDKSQSRITEIGNSFQSIERSQGYITNDELSSDEIKNLTADEYKTAFVGIREQMVESDLLMLKAHYKSPNFDITATELASKVGFPNFETANLRYGLLAKKLLEFFQIKLEKYAKLIVLVDFSKPDAEWHWVLRPQVIQALGELRWFEDDQKLNVLQEIELFKDSYETLPETTRESVIQSRIGQGQFRTSLVEYWQSCSVTGCKQIELLRASHIKPWRSSSNKERLDMYNGLLLLPNLDACFDSGLISFDDEGKILISSKLSKSTLLQLGVNTDMKLLRLDEKHKEFLHYHREKIFRP